MFAVPDRAGRLQKVLRRTRSLTGVSAVAALVLLALLVLWVVMFPPWFGSAQQLPQVKSKDEEFAADRVPPPDPAPFNTKRALGYLEAICKIGPRISGSDGMKQQQELLEKHFKDLGGQITWQRFTARQRSVRKPVDMLNLIVSWHPERQNRVILCSHYDTRPIADQERDPQRWRDPFISANDGGSGVAFLMELAHHTKKLGNTVGVDFVFFDGEEYVFEPRRDEYFFGSKHFAHQYRKGKLKGRYVAAVLLDMIAGKDPHFPIEQNSWFLAGPLVTSIWTVALELQCDAFRSNDFSKVPVEDDHIPLNRAGIPAVDIIDFDYPHWHKLSDVPENCPGEGLEQVARVLSVWLQRLK